MQAQTQPSTLKLVYYNFRGLAQNIRWVLLYLNVPFEEIFLQPGKEISTLPILKKLEVGGQIELPCLLDGNFIIQDCFAIIRHICVKAKRQDLLGFSLEEKTTIREIYYYFLLKKKKCVKLLFKFGEEAPCLLNNLQELRKKAMLYFHKQSGSLIPMIQLKLKHPNSRYLFYHLTVLDFFFYEECFYQVYLFGNLEEKNCKLFQTINSIFGTDLSCVKDKSTIYLQVMREFKQNFEKEEFYINNKEKLQSYTVLSPSMSDYAKHSFSKVWLGPGHYLKKSNKCFFFTVFYLIQSMGSMIQQFEKKNEFSDRGNQNLTQNQLSISV